MTSKPAGRGGNRDNTRGRRQRPPGTESHGASRMEPSHLKQHVRDERMKQSKKKTVR